MDVKIESDTVEVIASGTTIGFNGEPIKISFGPPADRFNIIIVFEAGTAALPLPGLVKPEVRSEILDPNTLRITFKNVNAPGGYGSGRPVPIGTIEGRRVYMHYRIYDLGGTSDKMIHYSFYHSKV